jgi:6-pyruvoyltetrahydropterin/6-carboxytetrahydropterin synthase
VSSKSRKHHLLKTFYTGLNGWRDLQEPDGTVVWTFKNPSRHRLDASPVGKYTGLMNDTAFDADDVYVATMHRADAPIGRTARFHMRTLFDDLPCCHRSWANRGKRFFLHGCERTFEIEFACAETEPDSGLVLETGSVKEVRSALRYQFDHTTLIADDDPQRDLFELLAERGVVDLRIMDNTSMEGSTGLGVRHHRTHRHARDRRLRVGCPG